jgi:rhomboid protease GluP
LATVTFGEWWRLVTPIFLHGGLLHFAFNSYALIQLGPLVEEEYGTERFVVLYLLSGIGGNILSQFLRSTNTVGASGAICGLMGLLLAYGMRRGGAAGGGIRASMTQSAIYMLIFSFLPGIDLLCHVGGFVTGFALGWVVPAGPFRSRAAAVGWDLLLVATLLLVVWCFWQMAQHGADILLRFGE